MKRIVLFRYHHQFERNLELLRFIKTLNPGVDIYGLYGGPLELFQRAGEILNPVLAHNYLIRDKSNEWKWKNSDIAYQLWFNDFGHTVSFDILHSYEWDLLYFSSLDDLFAHVPPNAAAFTGLTPLKKIEKKWYWTRNSEKREEWLRLMEFFRNNFGYSDQPYAVIGPGASLPREYFEKVANVAIPEISHDEIRFPLFAQSFGLKMIDTRFFRKWFSDREFKYFNANEFDIDIKVIRKELRKRNGRRVFHPVRNEISYQELMELHQCIKGSAIHSV